ncbi:MAG: glycosyltransferase family 4 protein [Acidithiobacillales bacterium]
MRVAIVVPGGVDRSGSGRVIPALLALVERLARRHDVHVVALRQEGAPGRWPLLGATVHNLGLPARGLPGTALLRFGPRLTVLLADAGPFDVVHAVWANEPALLAAAAARWRRLPLTIHLAGGELAALPEIGYGGWLHARERWKTRFALRSAARVTAGSVFLQRLAASRGIQADVIPLGVDPSLFAPGSRRGGPARRLLHVASLNAVKDQPTLLRALRRVADAEPHVHLDAAGEDTLGGAVQAEAERLGLSEHVTFHGLLRQEELRPLYRDADLFVLSSRHEAQSVAFLEAASAGLPTVGTAVGLVADLAPEAAVSVPVGDDAALAAALLALLRDDGRRRRIGDAARAWALANDADATASAFEKVYAGVAGAR